MWVLTYHSISSGSPPLCVAPERLAEHLDLLRDAGWTPVRLSECVAGWRRDEAGGRAAAEQRDDRRFAVTFDDGYRDFAEAALPILEPRGIVPTLFAVVADDREHLRGGSGAPLLSRDELRAVAAAGVEIGAHGIEHVDLCGADDLTLARELRDGRGRLADWVDAPVGSFAYPYGRFDARVRRAVAAEFEAAFTTQLARVPARPDRFAVPRVDACYLSDPWLQRAIRSGRDRLYLCTRRWLRRARGNEPRRRVPGGTAARGDAPAGPAPSASRGSSGFGVR